MRFMKNPFVCGQIVSGASFADRKGEIREISNDLKNGRNVLIYSPRQYGKTSLILEVLSSLREGGLLTMYLNFFPLVTKKKFAEALTASIARGTATKLEEMIRTIKEIISLTPKIVVRKEGLEAEIELGLKRKDVDRVLDELYDAPQRIAKKRGKRVIVVFDEFQEIRNLDGDEIERSMRTKFQHHDSVTYVFMGSRRHLLRQIFTSKARPLYNIAKEYPLGKIPRDDFSKFIIEKFSNGGFRMEKACVEKILDTTDCHPAYTQQLCYEIWELCANKKVVAEDVDAAVERVITLNSRAYAEIWGSLRGGQRAVLVALAKGDGEIYSSEFIEEHDLGYPQRVRKVLKSLETKELIEKNQKWEITDVFFKEWLKRLSG